LITETASEKLNVPQALSSFLLVVLFFSFFFLFFISLVVLTLM
jgi:hypothetical protein